MNYPARTILAAISLIFCGLSAAVCVAGYAGPRGSCGHRVGRPPPS